MRRESQARALTEVETEHGVRVNELVSIDGGLAHDNHVVRESAPRVMLAPPRPRTLGRERLERVTLIAADLVGLSLAALITFSVYGTAWRSSLPSTGNGLLLAIIAGAACIGSLRLEHLYDPAPLVSAHPIVRTLPRAGRALAAAFLGTALLAGLTGLQEPTTSMLGVLWLAATAGVLLARAVVHITLRRHARHRVIIVGAGAAGQLIAAKMASRPEYRLDLVGFVDDDPLEPLAWATDAPTVGGQDELIDLVDALDIDTVVFAYTSEPDSELIAAIEALQTRGVRVAAVSRLFDAVGPGDTIELLEGLALVQLTAPRLSRVARALKRGIDLTLAGLGLLLLSPLLVAIAIAIRLDSRGPVFYRHERLRENGWTFRLVKFRTMYAEHCRGPGYGGDAAERVFAMLLEDGDRRTQFEGAFKFADDPRVTRVGRLLRRTSLDELPQLWNVLRGELSLVGPRPITTDELARYGEHAARLLTLKPGVTGYWQVNGRSSVSYDERVRLDMLYASHWSVGLDLGILARTFKALLHRADAW